MLVIYDSDIHDQIASREVDADFFFALPDKEKRSSLRRNAQKRVKDVF